MDTTHDASHGYDRRHCYSARAPSTRPVHPSRHVKGALCREKAKYEACESKATGAFLGGGDNLQLMRATVKCRAKYDAAWVKLRGEGSGRVYRGNVRRRPLRPDRRRSLLTTLRGCSGSRRLSISGYTLVKLHTPGHREGPSSTAADGPAYTTFLATLNSNGCFAGQCDWRLPTRSELQTIKNHASDQALFGDGMKHRLGLLDLHLVGHFMTHAWVVRHDQSTEPFTTPKFVDLHVRAVRGGL